MISRRFQNYLQSIFLLASMALLAGLIGYMVAGADGLVWAGILVAMFLFFSPRVPPSAILKLYKGRKLTPEEAPLLFRMVGELGRRAGLPTLPEIYYIPVPGLNAFTIGTRRSCAVAVTDGILRGLTPRELAGVLAHEISHAAHNDMWVMGLADTASRITTFFSLMGQILLVVYLPMVFFGQATLPLVPILLLVLAPTISTLLQLTLSRSREYEADEEGALLSGDPVGLASALLKLKRQGGGLFERVMLPPRQPEEGPSVLRTHPRTEDRVARLTELAADASFRTAAHPPLLPKRVDAQGREHTGGRLLPPGLPPSQTAPKRRLPPLWR